MGCLVSTIGFSQGFYLSAGGGYGFGFSSQNLPDFYNSSHNNDSATLEQVNVSLGKWATFSVTAGYMIRKYLGTEISVQYMLGAKSTVNDRSDYGVTVYSYSANMLSIVPSVVVTASFDKINPYTKFGVIIGMGSVRNEVSYDEDSAAIIIRNYRMNGGVAFGGTASAGVLAQLHTRFSFFGEIAMVSLSYAPTKGRLTKAEFNGQDILPEMTIKEKETDYVDSYTYHYLSPSPDDQPAKALKHKLPFGSLGIWVGIRIKL